MSGRFLTHSTPALIAANAAATITAAAGHWNLGDLFRLYLIELVVVGFMTLAQMRRAARPGALGKSRGYQAIFFAAHYGTFCVFYLAILPRLIPGFTVTAPNFWTAVWIPAAAFAVAHVISFVWDYLPCETNAVSSMQAMFLPYARELPVHAPLVAVAAFLPQDLPSADVAVLFALGKTVADVGMHIAHHRRLAVTAS